jgi:hypothetical protein
MKYSQFDLLLGILDRVGSMADVATDSKRKVATNSTFFLSLTRGVCSRLTRGNKRNVRRTSSRSKWVSCAEHHTASLDGIEALPDHPDDGARSHVLDKTREERLVLQVLIVCTKKKRLRTDVSITTVCASARVGLTLLEVLGGGVDELQGDQLEAAFLEAADDFADETALDAVGLIITVRCASASANSARWAIKVPHLDHDVRAFVIGGHVRCFLLWLMQLTVGEKREMGSCEKERADFKQEADHPFCLPNSEIAAQYFVAHGHVHTPCTCATTGTPRLCPSYSLSTATRCSSVLLARLSPHTCAPLALSRNGSNPSQTGMPTCPATAE